MQYLNEELGILHRDLKPDNIMINENPLTAKIIDFGTCKDLTVESGPHTSYVSTRWYRAPELLVGDASYTTSVDVWAIGCIFAELFNGLPLFPGDSDLHTLQLIMETITADDYLRDQQPAQELTKK